MKSVTMTRANFDRTVKRAYDHKDAAKRDRRNARRGKIAEQMFWSMSRLADLNDERGIVRN